MDKKTVRNNMPDSAVTVAYATIPPQETKDILAKPLEQWLNKGGQRLVDSEKISIYEVGADVPVTVTQQEEEPKPSLVEDEDEDETTVDLGPDEGLTFDGKPASEAAGSDASQDAKSDTVNVDGGDQSAADTQANDADSASDAATDTKSDTTKEATTEKPARGKRNSK